MRRSTSLRSPNRLAFALAPMNASHLKPGSTTSTSRSSRRRARAAARIASPASSASSGSSPWTTYSGASFAPGARRDRRAQSHDVHARPACAACSRRTICCDRVGLHLAQQPLLLRSRARAPRVSLNVYERRTTISPAGIQSRPSLSCSRNVTRLTSWYSRTRAAGRQRQHVLVVDDDGHVERSTCAPSALSRRPWRLPPPSSARVSSADRRRRRRRIDEDRRERVRRLRRADGSRTTSAAAPGRQLPRTSAATASSQGATRQTTTLTSLPGTTIDLLHRRAGRVLRDLRRSRAPRPRSPPCPRRAARRSCRAACR